MKKLVFVLLALVWGSPAWAQEDEKCAASPRWIAVTVVKAYIQTSEQDMETATGVQLLDRCYGDSVQVGEVSATSRSPKAVAARGEGAKSFVAQVSGTGDNFIMKTSFIQETVGQLCAAMDDCGDATRESP